MGIHRGDIDRSYHGQVWLDNDEDVVLIIIDPKDDDRMLAMSLARLGKGKGQSQLIVDIEVGMSNNWHLTMLLHDDWYGVLHQAFLKQLYEPKIEVEVREDAFVEAAVYAKHMIEDMKKTRARSMYKILGEDDD